MLAECRRIEENCLYTGQAHFEIAKHRGKSARLWLTLVPALVSAVASFVVAVGAPKLIAAVASLSSAVIAIGSFLGAGKDAAAHENAGKLLTQLRDETRALRLVSAPGLTTEQLAAEVKALGTRYRAFVASLPTTDAATFEKVRARIRSGTFEFDSDGATPSALSGTLQPPALTPTADRRSLPASEKDGE
ncbi:MAG TPA: SLATT domain-containing protein [Kofleriaceae bacterium]|nr:SLATT domain-containing protein [Kofleriaceae bacterium]